MKNLSLVLRIVAILASAAAVALFFISKGKLAEKQTSLEQAQVMTQATQSELETANSKITSLGTQLSTERKSLADTKGKLESIRSEMYTAKQQVTRTQQQLKETKKTISELERTDLVKTEERLASASKEAELAQLDERIKELVKSNDTLKQDLLASEELQQSTSTTRKPASTVIANGYQSGFTPNSAAAVLPASIGAATTVASISTSDGIIILDASPELGLSVGSEIILIQNLKALGKIRIIQVNEQLAVANILPGTRLRGLSKGDTIKVMH
jgi:predicted RNase H-like nuclease (RuvC/YqgF family)